MDLKKFIATVPDFPIEGILFRDITPLMADGEAFRKACEELKNFAVERGAELIVGPESRGFIFGCPIAYALNIGFVPVRKPGKLPRRRFLFPTVWNTEVTRSASIRMRSRRDRRF